MTSSEKSVAVQSLMEASGVRFGTSGVRGLVSEITDELAFAYTLAFLQATVTGYSGRVAIAMDFRPSSPKIAAACAAAVVYAGMQVEFCGAIPTPALAYFAQQQGMPAIMITGSHIPFDRNGIKFYGLAGEISKADERAISEAHVHLPAEGLAMTLPDINPSARASYVRRYLDFFQPDCLAGLRVGFYEHSSAARELLTDILQALGAEVLSLGRTDDFVPIDTEAVAEVDVRRAHEWAVQHGFDAIVSTDGDADRPLIGDETGRWLRGDIVGLLCARYLGAQAVAAPISCNTAIEKSGNFQKVARTRIGSPFVIDAMAQLLQSMGNVAGFEANGGFLLGSRVEKNGRVLQPLMTRDAVLPIVSLLAMARENGIKVSQLTHDLPPRFTASGRLESIPAESSRRLMQELAASRAGVEDLLGSLCERSAGLDQTDGLRISFENDEIVHFRQSGNAPELRCYAEADAQERAEYLSQTALALIADWLR